MGRCEVRDALDGPLMFGMQWLRSLRTYERSKGWCERMSLGTLRPMRPQSAVRNALPMPVGAHFTRPWLRPCPDAAWSLAQCPRPRSTMEEQVTTREKTCHRPPTYVWKRMSPEETDPAPEETDPHMTPTHISTGAVLEADPNGKVVAGADSDPNGRGPLQVAPIHGPLALAEGM